MMTFKTAFACVIAVLTIANCLGGTARRKSATNWHRNASAVAELPRIPFNRTSIFDPVPFFDWEEQRSGENILPNLTNSTKSKKKKKKNSAMRRALRDAARKGLQAMVDLYDRKEPLIRLRGDILSPDDPATKLFQFSAPHDHHDQRDRAAYAALYTAKKLKESFNVDFFGLGRQAPTRLSLRRTPLEGMCPLRDPPRCVPATRRYRTHDGTCNNDRKTRWGSAQMPFHRFLLPEYADGVEAIRLTESGSSLPSARFVSLVVHGSRQGEAPVTLMLAQWGQFIDHDLTATAQPRSINGSVPRCCGSDDQHPACLTIRVPGDDPWLAPLNVKCLEFLRSAPAQRRDCVLSWREQINQATSYLDASTVYASNSRSSDSNRLFRDGLLLFGRGPPREDVCLRGALANQCIRPGDQRSGEQPGLLAMHTVWVGEHNRITMELGELNPHWSDEKLYQESRRIVGAMVQHITYREFLPLVLGKEVCRLFELELSSSGYFDGYNAKINPTVGNAFGSAAFRFGHSLIQGSLMRCDRNHRFIPNNVTLHEETARGDMGGPGSLHRLIRGMLVQRALIRDEFITAELTNHLFQSSSFPFGLDLAAINIQRGRDHGLPSYTSWRVPCGLSPIHSWKDLENVAGPESTNRISQAYRSVNDVDLFVGGLAERPVIGGLVGPTFACILAQQFSNTRRGDRFWYENGGFESSFTPAQLDSIRQVTLSQVLCRALNGGTLQPHAFLPPDIPGNERQQCGRQSLIRLDLLPWTERDPLNKQNDPLPAPIPIKQTSNPVGLSSNESNGTKKKKKKKPINVPVTLAQSESSPSIVDNKIDFAEVSTKKPVVKEEMKKESLTLGPQLHDKIDSAGVNFNKKKKKPQGFTGTTVNNKLDFTKRLTKSTPKPTTDKPEPRLLTDVDPNNDRAFPSLQWNNKDPNKIKVEFTWNHNLNNMIKPMIQILNDKIFDNEDDEDSVEFLTGSKVEDKQPLVQNEFPVTNPPYSVWSDKASSPFSYDKTTKPPEKYEDSSTSTFWAVNQVPSIETSPFDIRKPIVTISSTNRPTTSNLYYVSRPSHNYFSRFKSSNSKIQSSLDPVEHKTLSDADGLTTDITNDSKPSSNTISTSSSILTQTLKTDLIDFDDYDLTTLKPILSEDYIEETTPDEALTQFDRDGYLRPEYMNWDGLTLTDANKTIKVYNKDFQTIQFTLKNLTNGDAQPRRPINVDIDSELTDNDPSKQTDNQLVENKEQVAFVPLMVLTSPERPDNWMMIVGPQKEPLPEMPEIKQEKGTSSEVPKPMLLL